MYHKSSCVWRVMSVWRHVVVFISLSADEVALMFSHAVCSRSSVVSFSDFVFQKCPHHQVHWLAEQVSFTITRSSTRCCQSMLDGTKRDHGHQLWRLFALISLTLGFEPSTTPAIATPPCHPVSTLPPPFALELTERLTQASKAFDFARLTIRR